MFLAAGGAGPYPPGVTIRSLKLEEWDEVAVLIFESTNTWYQAHLNREVFSGNPSVCRVFPEVYERLDPGCCLVAEIEGQLVGSCFYHPRETHVGVGIVNAHPDFAGRGVARMLMEEVFRRAGTLPVRLVSSAMNLDSYSLYSRAGFTPVALYQDMIFPGRRELGPVPGQFVRPVGAEDVPALVALEEELHGIRRAKDFHHFIENAAGIWHGSVVVGPERIEGFLFSIDHPGSRLLGPGVMRSTEAALGLIAAELARFEGASPLLLVPAQATSLVAALYAAGARNCELHLAQIRGGQGGNPAVPEGIVLPSFLPESG